MFESGSFIIAVAGMFALGFAHAFGPDHLAAIAALAGPNSTPRRVLLTSMKFAFGHSFLLMAFGLGAFFFGFLPSEGAMRIAETIGGIALLGLGAVMLHAMFHRREFAERAERAALVTGSLLAASGTRSFILAIPAAATARDLVSAVLVAGSFGAGVILGMCVFGLFWGWSTDRFLTNHRVHRWADFSIAALTMMLGAYWALSNTL